MPPGADRVLGAQSNRVGVRRTSGPTAYARPPMLHRDHRDAMEAVCRRLSGVERDAVQRVAAHRDGFHLPNGGAIHWLPCAKSCSTANDVRREMVWFTREARPA